MTPDEALIAQLQEAHGRATPFYFCNKCGYSGESGPRHGLPGGCNYFASGGTFVKVEKLDMGRLIELAREAILSRAVVAFLDNRGRWCDSAILEHGSAWHLSAEESNELDALTATLASATRKETK